MKKTRFLVCIITLMAILLCSCAVDADKLSATSISVGDSDAIGDEVRADISVLWDSTYICVDDTAPATMQIVFNGKVYTGTYTSSCLEYRNDYITHIYHFEPTADYSYDGEFYIHSQTEELIGFEANTLSDGDWSQEDCLQKAEEIVSEYINVSEYNRTVKEVGRIYFIEYVKYYQGIQTSEHLYINLDKTGEVLLMLSAMLGRFPSDQQPISTEELDVSLLTSKAAEKVIKQKALESSTTGYYDRVEEIREPMWVMINGRMMLVNLVVLTSSKNEGHSNIYVAIEAAPEAELQPQTK